MSSIEREKQVIPSPMSAEQIFERWFLETRSRLLEVAANLDRIDRAPGGRVDDPRRAAIEEALRILLGPGPDRAERIQMIFSREYDPDWMDGVPLARPSSSE
jgi:hypothetical protein